MAVWGGGEIILILKILFLNFECLFTKAMKKICTYLPTWKISQVSANNFFFKDGLFQIHFYIIGFAVKNAPIFVNQIF